MALKTDTIIEARAGTVLLTVTYDDTTHVIDHVTGTNSSGNPVTLAITRAGQTRSHAFGQGSLTWTPPAGVLWTGQFHDPNLAISVS